MDKYILERKEEKNLYLCLGEISFLSDKGNKDLVVFDDIMEAERVRLGMSRPGDWEIKIY